MPKFHTLTVREVRRETPDCVSIAFDVPSDLHEDYVFTQGQYLTLKTELGGEEVRRSYSICSSPYSGELRVAVKRVEGGRFSTFANTDLQAGDRLDVMTPLGNFYTELDPVHENHYVAFAAGSGITPLRSIIEATLEKEPKSHFTLFYGNRGIEHIIFREAIEALKSIYLDRFTVHHVLSREHPGSELFFGHIDESKCDVFCKLLIDVDEVAAFFLCGPEAMIHAVRQTLLRQGVDAKRVHYELFTSPVGPLGQKSPSRPKPAKEVHASIEITIDGNTFSFDLDSGGQTILDAAIRSGADLPFACKGGVCSTCKAKLLEGEVDMDVNYALEPDEVEAGYVLTCQSHPRSGRVVVSYDL